MNVSEDLDRGLESEHDRLIFDDLFGIITQLNNFFSWKNEPTSLRLIDVTSRLQQLVQEFHMEGGGSLFNLHAWEDDVDLDGATILPSIAVISVRVRVVVGGGDVQRATASV